MSRPTTGRQLAKTLFQSASQPTPSKTRCAANRFSHPFSSSSSRPEDNDRRQELSRLMGSTRGQTAALARTPPPGRSNRMSELAGQLQTSAQTAIGRANNENRALDQQVLDNIAELEHLPEDTDMSKKIWEPYHFHIYSHKHNTHVTVTRPNRDAILSLSCGNLGFRKSNRKHYDSAYQLGAYVIDKLQQQGWHKKIDKLEISLRGFGSGREAVTKVLMGPEGKLWRDKIVRVSDSTRLKFGGTRSKNPRRLG